MERTPSSRLHLALCTVASEYFGDDCALCILLFDMLSRTQLSEMPKDEEKESGPHEVSCVQCSA